MWIMRAGELACGPGGDLGPAGLRGVLFCGGWTKWEDWGHLVDAGPQEEGVGCAREDGIKEWA